MLYYVKAILLGAHMIIVFISSWLIVPFSGVYVDSSSFMMFFTLNSICFDV